MTEYTGDYYRCDSCHHIYDFNDTCPECSSGEVEDISVAEVLKYSYKATQEEKLRLENMLISHSDLPF